MEEGEDAGEGEYIGEGEYSQQSPFSETEEMELAAAFISALLNDA